MKTENINLDSKMLGELIITIFKGPYLNSLFKYGSLFQDEQQKENFITKYSELLFDFEGDNQLSDTDRLTQLYLKKELQMFIGLASFTSVENYEKYLVRYHDKSQLFFLNIIKTLYDDKLTQIHQDIKKEVLRYLISLKDEKYVMRNQVKGNEIFRCYKRDNGWLEIPEFNEVYGKMIEVILKKRNDTEPFKILLTGHPHLFNGFIKLNTNVNKTMNSYYLWLSGVFPGYSSALYLEKGIMYRDDRFSLRRTKENMVKDSNLMNCIALIRFEKGLRLFLEKEFGERVRDDQCSNEFTELLYHTAIFEDLSCKEKILKTSSDFHKLQKILNIQ